MLFSTCLSVAPHMCHEHHVPFARRKRGQVLVVHIHRAEGGNVRQAVLHTFAAPRELAAALEAKGWSRWKDAMAWQHPDYRWDGSRLRRRLAELLDDWGAGPAGAVARRENCVR